MLTDFQPRCIMIFMAVSSEILLATRIAGRLAQSAISVAYRRRLRCWLRRPQSKKNRLSLPQFIGNRLI